MISRLCSSSASATAFNIHVETVELRGSARQMGEQFGEACRVPIAELLERRLSNAVEQARVYGGREVERSQLLDLARRCLDVARLETPVAFRELEGIARGAAQSTEAMWAMNQLTDLRDLAAFGAGDEGCTAVLVPPSGSTVGWCWAQTWDLATDNMPFVRRVVRANAEGPSTRSVTLTGCLSLMGVNEHGLSVGTTNLRATDNRIGVGYLDLIHEALHRADSSAALDVLRGSTRAAAHYYLVCDASSGFGLECTARMEVEVRPDAPFVHTNHMLFDATRMVEVAGTPMKSSRARLARMQALSSSKKASPSLMQAWLADREQGEDAIERRDFAGISTNAAVVFAPAQGQAWAVHGPPSSGRWIEL